MKLPEFLWTILPLFPIPFSRLISSTFITHSHLPPFDPIKISLVIIFYSFNHFSFSPSPSFMDRYPLSCLLLSSFLYSPRRSIHFSPLLPSFDVCLLFTWFVVDYMRRCCLLWSNRTPHLILWHKRRRRRRWREGGYDWVEDVTGNRIERMFRIWNELREWSFGKNGNRNWTGLKTGQQLACRVPPLSLLSAVYSFTITKNFFHSTKTDFTDIQSSPSFPPRFPFCSRPVWEGTNKNDQTRTQNEKIILSSPTQSVFESIGFDSETSILVLVPFSNSIPG